MNTFKSLCFLMLKSFRQLFPYDVNAFPPFKRSKEVLEKNYILLLVGVFGQLLQEVKR